MWRLLATAASVSGPERRRRASLLLLRPTRNPRILLTSILPSTTTTTNTIPSTPGCVACFSSASKHTPRRRKRSTLPSGEKYFWEPPVRLNMFRRIDSMMASTTLSAPQKHQQLIQFMQEAYAQGQYKDVSVLCMRLSELQQQEREALRSMEKSSSGSPLDRDRETLDPIFPAEAALPLSAAMITGHPVAVERTINTFFDSYPHEEGSGKCLIVEQSGERWWEPIAAELGKGRERGEEWQALWALYQEAKKRKIVKEEGKKDQAGEDGDGGLRAHVLKALSKAAAAAKEEKPLPSRSRINRSQLVDELLFTLTSPRAPEALLLSETAREEKSDAQQQRVHAYTPRDFHEAISFVVRGGLVDEGFGLLRRLTEQGQTPLPETYTDLIQGYAMQKRFTAAVYLFEEMREKTGTGAGTTGIIEKHQQADLEEETHTEMATDRVLSSYLEANGIDVKSRWLQGDTECLQALEQLTLLTETYGLRPERFSYLYVMDGLAFGGRGREAYQLLQQMKECGFRPDTMCYNKAIMACGRTGEMHSQAEELFREMPQEDKSALTYSLLMHSAAKAGKWQQTRTLLDEMKARGISPSTGCYNTVVNAYGKAGLLEDALAIFREMPKAGLQPDRITYTVIIDACARRAEADLAIAFLEEMEEGPNAVGASIVAYGSAVNACAKALQGKQALALVHEMQEKGLEVSEVVYTSAIDALNKSEDDDTALLELYEQIKAKGLTLLKANCGAALKACKRKGDPDKMVEVGHELVAASGGIIYPRALKQLLFAAEQTGKYRDGVFFYRHAVLTQKVEPPRAATKVAINCADKMGDLVTLRICLKEARKAQGTVEGWMVKVAFAAVDRAQAEAEERERQTGQPMSKRKAESIEKLKALTSSLWAEETERRKREGGYLGRQTRV